MKSVDLRLRVSPQRFSFRMPAGGEAPSPQFLSIQSSIIGFSPKWILSAPDFTGDWLWASYLEGTTPDVIVVWVDPKGLGPGRYTATVFARAPNRDASQDDYAPPVRIPIEFIIDPPNVASSVKLEPGALTFTVPRGGS